MTTLFYTALSARRADRHRAVLLVSPMPPGSALFGLGRLLGASGHFLLIKALQLAPASVLQPFSYTMLVWATVVGFLVFGNLPTSRPWPAPRSSPRAASTPSPASACVGRRHLSAPGSVRGPRPAARRPRRALRCVQPALDQYQMRPYQRPSSRQPSGLSIGERLTKPRSLNFSRSAWLAGGCGRRAPSRSRGCSWRSGI